MCLSKHNPGFFGYKLTVNSYHRNCFLLKVKQTVKRESCKYCWRIIRRSKAGVSESLQSFRCTECTVVSATRAPVKAGDCIAQNLAFIYIAFQLQVDVLFKAAYVEFELFYTHARLEVPFVSKCATHIQMCNFKVGLSGKAHAIKVN